MRSAMPFQPILRFNLSLGKISSSKWKSIKSSRSKIDKRGCLGAPDMIVEILSPSSLKRDTVEKFPLYERAGVREYWVVNPDAPSVNVFILQNDGQYDAGTVYEDDAKEIPVYIFDGLSLQWEDIFEK